MFFPQYHQSQLRCGVPFLPALLYSKLRCNGLLYQFVGGSGLQTNGSTVCLFNWTHRTTTPVVRAFVWSAVWTLAVLLTTRYYKHLWRRCRPCSHRPYAAGYCRQKSRLEPICQQNVVSHRLRSRKISHPRSFFDFQNAFPSQSTTAISGALDSVARLEDRQLWEQRYREALVRVSDGRAEADFRPPSGTMQGDGPSAELFLEPYHLQLDKWAQATAIK